MMKKKYIFLLTLLYPLCASVIVSVVKAQEAAVVTISGKVTIDGTDQPLRRIPLSYIFSHNAKGKPYEYVKFEKIIWTNAKGEFSLSLPKDTQGLNSVIIFTGAPEHRNKINGVFEFFGRIPTYLEISDSKIAPLDLTKSNTTVNFSLKPALCEKETVMIPMRDGTRLATDIYLPKGEGKFPVILQRTPYNKNKGNHKTLALLGYVVVVQDLRGRFASEGEDIVFKDDGWGENQDGIDTINWILKQPWCNGKIGTLGGSALGITQNLLAGAKPSNLICQHIAVAPASLYHQAVYRQGAFCKAMMEDWLSGNKFDPECLKQIHEHPTYDDYWKQFDSTTKTSIITSPALHIGGWYDCFTQGTIDSFVTRQNEGAEGARGKQKMIIGPWTHGATMLLQQGEIKFPENSRMIPEGDARAWFDFHLKGVQNGIDKIPPVHYYVMGDTTDPNAAGNVWKTSDVWPIPCKETLYYFKVENTLSLEKPGEEEKFYEYEFDPKNPVPTVGGNNLTIPRGPFDQQKVENRHDVILFTTEMLKEPLEVTGRVKVRLWASSSAVDTDFTAKLTDVYPDGRSMLVCDGITRARYRNSLEKTELLEPGKIYEFEIDLWSTSIIFNKGHKIRVAISSSNFPRFDVNPNTGKNSWDEENPVKAKNRIYCDSSHPSCIILPVITSKTNR